MQLSLSRARRWFLFPWDPPRRRVSFQSMLLRTRLLWLMSLCLMVVSLQAQPSAGQTNAEKLGFPAEMRLLIINVNEVGICWEANQAAKELLEGGLVRSASVVPTGPWVGEFADWVRTRPQVDVGVSLALHNPYPHCRWRFVAPEESIRSLVDAHGFPCESAMQMAMNASAEEAERELLQQIHLVRDTGIRITHLGSFDGSAFSRTDLAAVLMTIARQQWIPGPIVDLTPEKIKRFSDVGLELETELQEFVENYPLPKLDDIQFIPRGKSLVEKRDAFCQLLAKLPPGLVQIPVSPLVESGGVALLDPDWQNRVWDLQLLKDPKVKQTLKDAKIQITSWREVMERFERRGPEISAGAPAVSQETTR